MRRRLTVAMVLMVFGALVLAGVASLVLVVHNTRLQTRHELVHEAQGLALTVQSEAHTANPTDPAKALRTLLRALTGPLRLEGSAVIGVRADGALFDPAPAGAAGATGTAGAAGATGTAGATSANTTGDRATIGRAGLDRALLLPSGLTAGELDPTALLAGTTVSGTKGSLVYAAVPYRAQIEILGAPRDVVQVVVLTRQTPSALAGAGLWFGVTSLAILIVTVIVARQLGRRFARPLEAAQTVTSQIAAGDLDARVPDPPRSDPELAALAHSINAMAASLSRAQGAQRQFLLSVSHDLRTPLTSIRGFAEAIEDGVTADVLAAASVIASEARRLERLVADLLALAMLEARRFTLQLQPLDLTEAAATAAAGFAPAAADGDVALLDDSPSPRRVYATADPDRVAQVAANLVENALRYASHEVRVGAQQADGQAELWVQDDGPGIAAADLPRVFDRLFISRPNAEGHAGSGLGLAIVAELAAAMGGSVRAESPLGPAGGTRIIVSLPSAGVASTPVVILPS